VEGFFKASRTLLHENRLVKALQHRKYHTELDV